MMLMELVTTAMQAMLPYIAITMVLFYAGDAIDLIKKAVGVKR